jgi:hypothetical protein
MRDKRCKRKIDRAAKECEYAGVTRWLGKVRKGKEMREWGEERKGEAEDWAGRHVVSTNTSNITLRI